MPSTQVRMGLQAQGAGREGTVRALPLTIDDVHHRWGSAPVLRGASLTVPAATVAWLGGPNGAGKTTLLRIAGGLLAPARGRVTILGLDPERDRRSVHRRLGYLSAGDRGLHARLTVIAHLELWASLAFVPRDRRHELIEGTLARFELGDLRGRRVDRLSMGQRQRVRLATAFLHEPELVLLDEPHTSLDELGLALLEDAMAAVTGRGGAVLWCSPDATTLPLPADERHLLCDGEVIPA